MSIESIRQRLDAATPEPWRVSPRPGTQLVAHWIDDGRQYELFRSDPLDPNEAANVDLVVHAPTDLALLLEVAEAAREARDSTGVEYADERLRYAVLQIDREDWTRLMAALDALEAAE